jgi:integrase
MGDIGQRVLLGESKPYQNFVDSLRSSRTLKTYNFGLRLFMGFRRVSDVSELLKDDPKLIESEIIEYIIYLKNEKKVSYSHRMTSFCAIKHFYRMNDIDMRWFKISKYLGEETRVVKDRAYTTEEIGQILTKADERMRVVVLILASTGMRIGAIPELVLGNLIKSKPHNLYQINVYSGSREEYYCFCSPECALAIDSYLGYRDRFSERLTPESPLIRNQFDPNDSFQVRYPKRLSYRTIANLLDALLIKSGVHTVAHSTEGSGLLHGRERKSVARSHGFRKFVITNMIRAKLDFISREMLVGHDTKLDRSYYRPEANELLEEYLKVIGLITISQENRLKLENLKIKQRNESLEREKDEVITLRKDLEPLIALKKTLIKEGILKES